MTRLERILSWRCKWLPSLTFRQWVGVWIANSLGLAVYWVGRWLDWWPASDLLASFQSFLFFMLALTPLDFSGPRVFYLTRRIGSEDDFTPVPWHVARRLRHHPHMEVHKVWMKAGEVVKGERIS